MRPRVPPAFLNPRWPPQVDHDTAARKLWEAHESALALPMHMVGLIREEAITPELMVQRLRCLGRSRMEWLLRAELGNVR